MREEAVSYLDSGSKILENCFGTNHCMYLDSLYTKITLSFDLTFPQEEIDQALDDHYKITSRINTKKELRKKLSLVVVAGQKNSASKSEFAAESLLMKVQVLLFRNSERREPYRGKTISQVDQVFLQDACKDDIAKAEEVLQDLDLLIMETTGQANGNAFVWRATILIGLMLAQSGE